MGWTTPRTWVTGEIVTAAYMNTHVRDNENALKDVGVGDIEATLRHRHLTGAIGGRPAAGNAGRIYLVVTAGQERTYIEDGSEWLQLLLMADGSAGAVGDLLEGRPSVASGMAWQRPNFWPYMPPPSTFP